MIFSKETLKAIERNKKLSVEFGKTIQEYKHKGTKMIINLTHVQAELIKAYLEGKEIEYKDGDGIPWKPSSVYSYGQEWQDPVIICIMNMEDGYVRVKVPEPVITYSYQAIDNQGGGILAYTSNDKYTVNQYYEQTFKQYYRKTYIDDKFVSAEVVSADSVV